MAICGVLAIAAGLLGVEEENAKNAMAFSVATASFTVALATVPGMKAMPTLLTGIGVAFVAISISAAMIAAKEAKNEGARENFAALFFVALPFIGVLFGGTLLFLRSRKGQKQNYHVVR